jgi:hypothetical protein
MDTVSVFLGYEPSSVVEFWPSTHKPCMWFQPLRKKLFKESWRWTVVMVAHCECMVIGPTAMCLPTQTTYTIVDPYIVTEPRISYCLGKWQAY